MSVRVMAWVWSSSESTSSARFVLLAIADAANDAGAEAYPSMATLVKKTRLSERTVQAAIRTLEALGELVVYRNAGPKGCNRYRIVMRQTPAESAPPQISHPAESAGADLAPPQNPSPDPADPAPPPPQNLHPNHPLPIQDPPVEPSSSETVSRPDVEQICAHLADKIEANGSKRPTITPRWRTDARLLLDRDGRTVAQVIKAIDWCQSDEFWRANVLSMASLRKQYDRLRLAAQRGRASPNGLVEHNGFHIRPETAEHIRGRARFAALDEATEAQKAIEQ